MQRAAPARRCQGVSQNKPLQQSARCHGRLQMRRTRRVARHGPCRAAGKARAERGASCAPATAAPAPAAEWRRSPTSALAWPCRARAQHSSSGSSRPSGLDQYKVVEPVQGGSTSTSSPGGTTRTKATPMLRTGPARRCQGVIVEQRLAADGTAAAGGFLHGRKARASARARCHAPCK